jgi:hypothetical protein
MTENNNFYDIESIESELFSLIKSITNLNSKYLKGIVNENFFRKTLKNAMNSILKLNFTIKEKNLLLPELLKRMNLSQEFHSVIDIINRVSSLNIPEGSSSKKNTFLELPGITSEITSSFITLMDALTLEGLTKNNLIINLFEELTLNLSKFPGMEENLIKVSDVKKRVEAHIDELAYDPNFKKDIIDSLYRVFKEFQNKLSV